MHLQRRSFVQMLLAALSSTRIFAQASVSPASADRPASVPTIKPALVPAGADRAGNQHAVGVSSTTFKVLTAETGGALFVVEQANGRHGGPPKHLHFSQDELFYVLEGSYLVEIGTERFHLNPGDSVLGPRGIPHTWAFVGDTNGRMLLSYAPAGRMEEFFSQQAQLGVKPGAYAGMTVDKETMRSFGLQPVGPPIKLDS